MSPQANHPWISYNKVAELVQIEPAMVILGLALCAWLIYKLFLRGVSVERHRNLRGLFSNLSLHLSTSMVLFAAFYAGSHGLDSILDSSLLAKRSLTYLGLLAFVSGLVAFIKTCRILVFEYLFLSHMRDAVPVLLVNLITLMISIFVSGWVATELFNVQLASVIATSAVLSLVLGLALQDTLGHLFAGIALQFDKPYEIGDWIEIQGSGQKWAGQVQEISWRATILLALGDELITVPNRVMAQSEIANFSARHRPIIRSQLFRINYGAPIEPIKELLVTTAREVSGVRKHPEPVVFVTEAADSWMLFKLIYFIEDYGAQYSIADRVISRCLVALEGTRVALANPKLELRQPGSAADIASCNTSHGSTD